jgi:hypothetical protein
MERDLADEIMEMKNAQYGRRSGICNLQVTIL